MGILFFLCGDSPSLNLADLIPQVRPTLEYLIPPVGLLFPNPLISRILPPSQFSLSIESPPEL